MVNMGGDATPWAVILGFVASLAATVIMFIRGLQSGRIVVGRHYEDALKREVAWQKVAETALEANRQSAKNQDVLMSSVADLAAGQRETLALVRRLAPRAAQDAA